MPWVSDSFSGAVRAASYEFPPASEEDPRLETAGEDSHHAPEAWCSRNGILQAQRAQDWCFPKETLQTQISNEATEGLAPSVFAIFRAYLEQILAFFCQRAKANRGEKPQVWIRVVFPKPGVPGRGHCRPHSNTIFDPSLEYSTNEVVTFWQPPSYTSPWSPSSFVVDDVPYSCAEQYMMAETTRLFQDHRAMELIISSPRPRTRKRIGRGVRIFDSGVVDREKQNAVLSGTYEKFTQNPLIIKSPLEL